MITGKDRERLRALANKQLEYAKSPATKNIIIKWQALAKGQRQEPIVRMSFGAYRDEIIYPRMICGGEFARRIEETLLANMAGRELFDDDSVTPDYYPKFWETSFNLWGIDVKSSFLSDPNSKKLAYHIDPVIKNLGDDFSRFSKGTYSADKKKTYDEIDEINNCIGDILPVKITMACLNGSVTNKLVRLMGMENMYLAMMDYPDEFHAVMRMACEGYEEYFAWLAAERLLCPTTGGQPLNQDTYCYTDELPTGQADLPPGQDSVLIPDSVCAPNLTLGAKQVWGYMDSQESAAISPDMYGEFVFPYLSRIASGFGLLSYGCCEPVHPIWDKYLSTLSNLRRVSVSAWCDEEFMGERLRGSRIVFHRKPKSHFLVLNNPLDENEITAYFKKTALAARGCMLEVTQREVSTIHSDTARVRKYLNIIRGTLDKYWRP
ncbi:MAG: hypothetical protein FWD78_11210 [Treponema sp.]|nr:hypothetical protein [Treponema sp.]